MKMINRNCREFNPKTLEMIRNLRSMGNLEEAIHDILSQYAANWCVEKGLITYEMAAEILSKTGLESFAIHDLLDEHLQEWCFGKSIYDEDHIIKLTNVEGKRS